MGQIVCTNYSARGHVKVNGYHDEIVKKESEEKKKKKTRGFQMPLHYPRYTKDDYEKMPEWKLDCLLNEYGFITHHIGDVNQKRKFAMGAFLWN